MLVVLSWNFVEMFKAGFSNLFRFVDGALGQKKQGYQRGVL